MLAACLAAAAVGSRPAQGEAQRVDELIHDALQLDVHVDRGREIYEKNCASCHGLKAHGDPNRGIPSLAGQRQAYVVKQLADFSERERESRNMHSIVSRVGLSEPQVWADVAAYVNGLAPIGRPQHGDGRHLELGEAIFREQCSSCHEEDARGDDDGFVPSLRNQHYAYLLKETRTMGRWHARNIEEDLARFLNSLEEDEIVGLADYLSRLHGPTKDRLRMRDDGSAGD
jgi:cytochrome c553